MTRARVKVVKVGGSLLASADFPSRLRRWLQREAAKHHDTHFVLLAGGGKLADAVRDVDAATPLGEEPAHWICVELLDVTGRLLAAMLPELSVVAKFSELEPRLRCPGTTLLLPGQFVKVVEPKSDGTRLARDWSVTSDSIAARLAIILAAEELVLLKSVDPPLLATNSVRLARLAVAGYVDSFLPRLELELSAVRAARLP